MSRGALMGWFIGGFLVVFVLLQVKGGNDGCEASGRQVQGAVECVELTHEPGK